MRKTVFLCLALAAFVLGQTFSGCAQKPAAAEQDSLTANAVGGPIALPDGLLDPDSPEASALAVMVKMVSLLEATTINNSDDVAALRDGMAALSVEMDSVQAAVPEDYSPELSEEAEEALNEVTSEISSRLESALLRLAGEAEEAGISDEEFEDLF